jgi:UDP-MurNAc hydroxylase
MKIRFVSHASFSIESNGTTLLCDPWLFGKAFNQGWALLSPSAPVSWEDIDYVWISHQHPDHLHFPTLKSLTAQQRSRLTMLYQKHASQRIPKVLKGLGYSTVEELKLNRWIPLRGGIEVMCGSAGSMDSWIAVRADGITLLNLNDCVISPGYTACIAKQVGDVTILLTQFSFANWIGNHADELGEAERKLQDLQYRVKFLGPKITIPFASFIYFCNQENSWMNSFAVTPQRVADLDLPGVNFMYPGDEWDSDKRRFNSDEAVSRYMSDLEQPKTIDETPPSVSSALVEQSVNRTLRTVRGRFGRAVISKLSPFSIYLHDLNQVLVVNPAGACQVLVGTKQNTTAARYVMCSQVAWYAFAYSWGWGALEVSGMYLDRDCKSPNRLAFYLNLLATECVSFDSTRHALRTLEFFWAKRHELTYRLWKRCGHMATNNAVGASSQSAPPTPTAAA